jgi:ABC-2 type transport system permease protein
VPASVKAGLRDAVAVEFRKARSSRVLWSTGVLLAVGVATIAAAMVLAARSGDPDILAKLGPQAASGDWPAFVSVAVQITSAAAVLAYGVGVSWLYGREFADGTIPGLFGLPIGRGTLAVAKLVVYQVWAACVALALVLLLLGAGIAVGLGAPDPDTLVGLGRLVALGLLTALIAVPCAFATSLGRGLLPGIAAAVAILVISQVSMVADLASWVPFVAPALWAIHPDASAAVMLVVVPMVPLIFGAATVLVWRRLQLDR